MDWGVLWSVLLKILILSAVSLLTTLGGVLLSKLIIKHNNSRIYKYAKTLVEAAEQKFPNEGTKMGPQKQDYVMSQLAIKFPSIRDNQYLYNIVLQCVYELNQELQTQKLKVEFENKYGEHPNLEIDLQTTTNEQQISQQLSANQIVNAQITTSTNIGKKKRPSSF